MIKDLYTQTAPESGLYKKFKDKFMYLWPDLTVNLLSFDKLYNNCKGNILVIGSGRIAKIKNHNVINSDIHLFPGVNIVADAQTLPFKNNSFSLVVAHQVLEHIPSSHAAVNEICRVLAPKGKVIITVPFYFPFHASPYDFRRWTSKGLCEEFSKLQTIRSGMYIGPVSALLSCIQNFLGILMPNILLSCAIRFLFGWLIFPVKYLDYLICHFPLAFYMAASEYYIGEKINNDKPS